MHDAPCASWFSMTYEGSRAICMWANFVTYFYYPEGHALTRNKETPQESTCSRALGVLRRREINAFLRSRFQPRKSSSHALCRKGRRKIINSRALGCKGRREIINEIVCDIGLHVLLAYSLPWVCKPGVHSMLQFQFILSNRFIALPVYSCICSDTVSH